MMRQRKPKRYGSKFSDKWIRRRLSVRWSGGITPLERHTRIWVLFQPDGSIETRDTAWYWRETLPRTWRKRAIPWHVPVMGFKRGVFPIYAHHTEAETRARMRKALAPLGTSLVFLESKTSYKRVHIRRTRRNGKRICYAYSVGDEARAEGIKPQSNKGIAWDIW
jgi:hypothetical protein